MPASILSQLEWDEVDSLVSVQQRSRERHTPPISLFRWWARRPHALIGALLDAAATGDQPMVVSDPFSGGGTVAMEAALRGHTVYAQDLHPWAMTGLAAALDGVDADELYAAAGQLARELKPWRRDAFGSCCPEHGAGAEVLVAFWVRQTDCLGCAAPVALFPYSLVTRSSRGEHEPSAWWGCRACGQVSERPLTGGGACDCGHRFEAASQPLLAGRRCLCPSCGFDFAPFAQRPVRRTMCLVRRECQIDGRARTHFGRPTSHENWAGTRGPRSIPEPLAAAIPPGLETAVLHRTGFEQWSDLYTPRQLRVLTAALRAVGRLELSEQIRDRLLLAVCGAAEMAGHASRWDRYYPKAFEALANHRYSITGLAAEVNVLADQGRGTIPRRLQASVRAAAWMSERARSGPARRFDATARRRRPSGVTLACGSSERQLPSAGSVDLVLTDPPYFDDVQYAELAALFLVWSQTAGLAPHEIELDLCREAVANNARGTGPTEYGQLLAAIFGEARRTLKPSGRLVITFHNTDLRAWWALSQALSKGLLAVRALAVAKAENSSDHAKRGLMGFTCDLVIEAGLTKVDGPPKAARPPADDEGKELMAAGMAVAGAAEDYQTFCELFASALPDVADRRIAMTQMETA